jgi:spore germination protein
MTRQHLVRATVASAALAVVALTAGCTGSTAAASNVASLPTSLHLEAYGVEGAATARALASDARAVDTVGISSVDLTAQGAGVAASTAGDLDLLKAAHKGGATGELLVTNVDAATGDFSPRIASVMLSSEANRQFVIAGLAGEVEHGGYDGVQLDLESLGSSDAAGLVSFAAELRSTLPASATISMAVSASDTADGYAAAGYDLARLDASIDRFVLMAYDEHGVGFSAAGPVGGLPWATQALGAMSSLVRPAKIDLGVAGYGYSWKADGSGRVVTPAEARKTAGDRARWVAAQGEWTAKLQDGTVLWWSDARSLTVRANLAVSQKLHGLALWQLATADPVKRAG